MKKKLKLGDGIPLKKGKWVFSGLGGKIFDKHISKSIPLYDQSHDIGLKISDFFLTEKSHMYDLGCSTGTFLNKIANRNNNKKICKFTGIDEIKDMCKISKKNNRRNKNVKISNIKIEKLKFKKSALISSFYTMQFIHPSKRQKIFNNIFKNLQWGGGFLVFEKVRANDARFQDMITQIYNDYKLNSGFNANEILSKSKSLQGVMEPFSSKANEDMLKRAGFKDIICVMKLLCFQGWLAIK